LLQTDFGYHPLGKIVIRSFSQHGGFNMPKIYIMPKTYIVRLNDEERTTCLDIIKKLKGSSTKVRRANILLKTDADGPIGLTKTSPMPFYAVGKPSKTFENDSLSKALTSPSTARNEKCPRHSNGSMVIKKRKSFKVAIVAVMRKLITILNVMVKTNTCWQEQNTNCERD